MDNNFKIKFFNRAAMTALSIALSASLVFGLTGCGVKQADKHTDPNAIINDTIIDDATTKENPDGSFTETITYSLSDITTLPDNSEDRPVVTGPDEEGVEYGETEHIVAGDMAGLANPWLSYADKAEAEASIGYEISLPEQYNGYDFSYGVMQSGDDKILEVNAYTADENGVSKDIITIRKGISNGDITGDYNTYNDVRDINVNDISVEIRGNDGLYNAAVWTADGYWYSVMTTNAVSSESLGGIVAGIK